MDKQLTIATPKEIVVWICLIVMWTAVQAVNPLLKYAFVWDAVWMEMLIILLSSVFVGRAYINLRMPPLVKPEIATAESEPTSPGYVYLIKSSTGFWKIGMTVNPEDRIETFTVKLPFYVEYEHIIPCNNRFTAERMMHQLFRHGRKNGEWFDLSASDVAFIKAIKRL